MYVCLPLTEYISFYPYDEGHDLFFDGVNRVKTTLLRVAFTQPMTVANYFAIGEFIGPADSD